tara:strand:+ start:368 stop:820 length:453 start_codon:yes stop_codon:yes gene_type:complete
VKKEIEFLKKIGCEEIPHDSRNLLQHLVGVQEMLAHYERPEYEQRAGLFHAIYGTEFFQTGLNVDREIVQKNIGIDAEEIVHWFCQPGVRPFRIMGGLEFGEPLKTSLRWLDYCNGMEQHGKGSKMSIAQDDMVFENVMHLYEMILGICP